MIMNDFPVFDRKILHWCAVKHLIYLFSETNCHLQTCHAILGCRRSSIYCVRGEGSTSYLSNGRFSTTIASEFVQENFTIGCAVRGGN